ncbi:MAG: 50S ribosomal protein L15 [Syntrophus sp. PtaB.Bin001]|jgi:large subunit ribosomal protein L15|nr:MAG: 50S ribosomal protein L15 [Syntrophus sp. PtaB.Bin001]
MYLNQLKPPEGSRKKKKRIGRGSGSGHGGTACKGHKGQNARSGGGVRDGFEGGQMPLTRRLPKRGFKSKSSNNIRVLNVGNLNAIQTGIVIDESVLKEKTLVKKSTQIIKILGKGDIDHPLTVKVGMISRGAKEKIEAAGGSIIEEV